MENEENEIKVDKIFDNNFGSTESLEDSSASFQIDPDHTGRELEEKIDELFFFEEVKNLLTENPKYEKFNKPNDKENYIKINKNEINEIYRLVIDNVKGIGCIEAFSIITSIYDITPEKFYESLSNKFKIELIDELKNRGYLKNRLSLF